MRQSEKINHEIWQMRAKLALLLMIITINVCSAQTISQERASHQKIKAFITDKYPQAVSIKILDEYGGYRVTFRDSSGKYVASFSSKDKWVRTEKKIIIANIPDRIKQGLQGTKYSDVKILTAKEVMLPDEISLIYLLEVRATDHNEDGNFELGNAKDYKLYFTNTGKLSKEEAEQEALQSIPWGGQ
jgi:hypothetical protein